MHGVQQCFITPGQRRHVNVNGTLLLGLIIRTKYGSINLEILLEEKTVIVELGKSQPRYCGRLKGEFNFETFTLKVHFKLLLILRNLIF